MNKWQQFLNEVFEGDQQRIALLQQWVKLALNNGPDKKPLILHGPSRSGKSVTGRIIEELFGDTATRFAGRVPSKFKPKNLVVIDDCMGQAIPVLPTCHVVMVTNRDPEVVSDRLVIIPFKKSFFGKERVDILAELTAELESIRQWALTPTA